MPSRRSLSPWRQAGRRSQSPPRIRRQSSAGEEDSKRHGWAPRSWFLTPQMPRGRQSSQTKHKSTHHPLLRRTPALTLLLIRVNESMEGYCEKISEPTVERAAAASAILEAAVATASSPTSSPSSSPVGTPVTYTPRSPLSPQRASPRSSASAMALEGEFEKYISPLLLFALAEAVYAQMEHVMGSQRERVLTSLYKKVEEDLQVVRQTLCSPFLGETQEQKMGESVSTTESTYLMAQKSAKSLSQSLDVLISVSSSRMKLINIQKDLFESMSDTIINLSVLCRALLSDLPADGDKEKCDAAPVLKSLLREIKALASLLSAVHHLQRCSFMETVLSANMLKVNVRRSPATPIQFWFRNALEMVLSVMPIFFDRVDAFSKPLYGFDKKYMHMTASGSDRIGIKHDLESFVVEFLRRHDSKGGAPLTVSIVLDARRASIIHIDRGFQCLDAEDQEETSEKWPAVYIRTTVHSIASGSSRSSLSKLGAFRTSKTHLRNLSKGEEGSITHSGSRKSWSSDGSSPKRRQRKQPQLNVLEYAPESGRPSWPHSEWDKLQKNLESAKISIVGHDVDENKSMKYDGILTFRGSERNLAAKPDVPNSFRGNSRDERPPTSPITVPWLSDSKAEMPTSAIRHVQSDPGSSFYIKRLTGSEFMWIAVIQKEETAKWHRRKPRGHAAEDVCTFMQDLSDVLSMDKLFKIETMANAKEMFTSAQGLPQTIDLAQFLHTNWNESEIQNLLGALKQAFGLRPQSPVRTPLKSPHQIGYYNRDRMLFSRFGRNQHAHTNLQADHFDSAVAFFLGSDLRSQLQWFD